MNKTLKIVIQVLILILLIGAVIYFAGDKVEEAISIILKANLYWIGLIVLISLASHLARAYRWKIMMQPMSYDPSLWHTFIAVMTGYFTNIFNMRGGEALRCVVLTRSDKIPFATSFATVMAERVFDLLCLIILIVVALFSEYTLFLEFIDKQFLINVNYSTATIAFTIIVAAVIGLLTLYLIFRFRELLFKIKFVKNIYDYILNLFIQAIDSFRLMNKKKEFVVSTLLIWIGYYLTTYLAFFALPFEVNLDAGAAFLILVLGAIAVSVPIPGNLGYAIVISKAAQFFYGLSEEKSNALAFLLYATQLITLLFLGGACATISLFIAPKPKEEKIN